MQGYKRLFIGTNGKTRKVYVNLLQDKPLFYFFFVHPNLYYLDFFNIDLTGTEE